MCNKQCITYLQYHSAQLGREQQLLPLRDQGVDDEVLLHVCDCNISTSSFGRGETANQMSLAYTVDGVKSPGLQKTYREAVLTVASCLHAVHT